MQGSLRLLRVRGRQRHARTAGAPNALPWLRAAWCLFLIEELSNLDEKRAQGPRRGSRALAKGRGALLLPSVDRITVGRCTLPGAAQCPAIAACVM